MVVRLKVPSAKEKSIDLPGSFTVVGAEGVVQASEGVAADAEGIVSAAADCFQRRGRGCRKGFEGWWEGGCNVWVGRSG